MHSRAGDSSARIEHGLMHTTTVHSGTSERRQQSRVNVHHTSRVARHDLSWDELQVPGERDEIDRMLVEERRDTCPAGIPQCRERRRRNPMPARALERGCIVAIAGHEYHVTTAAFTEAI